MEHTTGNSKGTVLIHPYNRDWRYTGSEENCPLCQTVTRTVIVNWMNGPDRFKKEYRRCEYCLLKRGYKYKTIPRSHNLLDYT